MSDEAKALQLLGCLDEVGSIIETLENTDEEEKEWMLDRLSEVGLRVLNIAEGEDRDYYDEGRGIFERIRRRTLGPLKRKGQHR